MDGAVLPLCDQRVDAPLQTPVAGWGSRHLVLSSGRDEFFQGADRRNPLRGEHLGRRILARHVLQIPAELPPLVGELQHREQVELKRCRMDAKAEVFAFCDGHFQEHTLPLMQSRSG